MEKRKKVLIFATIILSLAAIVLVVTSLATDYWVQSSPKRTTNTSTEARTSNEVAFGLFNGEKTLDFSFGVRREKISITCLASKSVCAFLPKDVTDGIGYLTNIMSNKSDGTPLYEYGIFNYGLWVSTIVAASVNLVFGLVSIGFAVFNMCGKPIETITGPMGLYLWNGFAFLFTLIEMVVFLVLFLTSLSKNFLVIDRDRNSFDVEGETNLGFSFFLVVGAALMYLVNIILLVCTGYKLKCSFSSEAEKVVDNGMILY